MTKRSTGKQAGKTHSVKSRQWANQVLSISVNTRQAGIEIRFNAEPSPQLQPKLRVMGFRNSRTKTMWYADQTKQALEFAESIKAILPIDPAGPHLQLSPSFDALEINLNKKDFSYVIFTLKSGQTRSYIMFEPSKPRAEVIAANFAEEKFGDRLLAFAVMPRTQIKSARILFNGGMIIYPQGPSADKPNFGTQTKNQAGSSLASVHNEEKSQVLHILLTTKAVSRNPDYTAGVEVNTWKEANAWVKSKIGKHISDVYYKITWKDGEEFIGMVDLEPSEFYDHIEEPLSNHVRTFLTNYSNIEKDDPFYSKESVDEAIRILDNCLFEDVSEATLGVKKANEKDQAPKTNSEQKEVSEREALDKFYKWMVRQDDLTINADEVTLAVMSKWFHENMPDLSDATISSIFKSHQDILKSLKIKLKKRSLKHPFDSIYKKILKVIPGLLEHIKEGRTAGKSKVDPEGGLMALNYDFVGYDKNRNPIIALSHYYVQEGDPMPDPDMEIRLIPDMEIAEALSIKDYFGLKEVYHEKNGKTYVNKHERNSQNRFLNQWLTNIIHQGHTIDLSEGDDTEGPTEPGGGAAEEKKNPGAEANKNTDVQATQERILWVLIHKVIQDLKLKLGIEQSGEIKITNNQGDRIIEAHLKRFGNGADFRLSITDSLNSTVRFQAECQLKPVLKAASVLSVFLNGEHALQPVKRKDGERRTNTTPDETDDMNRDLNVWLQSVVNEHLSFRLREVRDDKKDAREANNDRANLPAGKKQDVAPVSGTPVFDPTVMARLITRENYFSNAWALSYPKSIVEQETFSKEFLTHLRAFFSIYVMEDQPMQEKYLAVYREVYTKTVDLTFDETGTPLPNVLLPAGTREPFYSHNWRAYDMRSFLQNSFASLTALNNENINSASPVQLYELVQLGNPASYRIAVSQEKLIEVWRKRGKELFNILGLPTHPGYPYADLIAGYENMMSLNDLLHDRNTTGDEWWIAAALYRPIADLTKAKTILEKALDNKKREKQSYLTADGKRPRPNYKSQVEHMDRTIGYLEESLSVLQAYAQQVDDSPTTQTPSIRKDHLADENGLYTERSAGDQLERIEVPMPPEADFEAKISIVRSSKGYKIGLSASKDFGSKTFQGILPRQTNESFLTREQALQEALNIHAEWLNEMLAAVDDDEEDPEANRRRLLLAQQALEAYAQQNGLNLNMDLHEAGEEPPEILRDPLTNESGVYTRETAGDNLEEIEIPMPKTAQYTAEIKIVRTSAGAYKKGISAMKKFGDSEGMGYSPGSHDLDFPNRNAALKAALLEHEAFLERLLASKDSILDNEEKKNKQLSMALKAVIDFAREKGIELDETLIGENEQSGEREEKTPALEEQNKTSASDPLADEDGVYTELSAGKNFETIEIPMPRSAGYNARVFLVKTSTGVYKQGIVHSKNFGSISYSASFPEVRNEAYPVRKAALKAALLHHEQELEVQIARKDTILNNEASQRRRLMLAMKALYKFAEENHISMKAEPDKEDGIIPGLETAYWKPIDADPELNRIIVKGQVFHQVRLRSLINVKLEEMPLAALEEIRTEVASRFRERRPFSSYAQGRWAIYKKGEARKAALIATYIDEIIIDHDLKDKEHAPVLSLLIDLLFSGATRLVDVPKESRSPTEMDKPVKRLSQHELNQEIEKFIDEKDKTGAFYDEQEKNYLRQYTGSGGLIAQGAAGRGTLYEYYTPDGIVKKMWDIAYHYGYDGGSILEPAVGTGNFLKYAPTNAEVHGYETNHYACRIAQILYPKAHIEEKAFETHFFAGNITLKDKFRNPGYSLVIGNPPYGTFTGKYAGLGEKKHTGASEYDQYFTLRSLDLLKPSGLLVFLVPSYFMLSMQKYDSVKKQIISKSEWVDGYRFPEGAFPNTGIGTDIMVLRKKLNQ